MEQKTLFMIMFVLGLIFTLTAAFIILLTGEEFLFLSITFIIVGLILISISSTIAKKIKS